MRPGAKLPLTTTTGSVLAMGVDQGTQANTGIINPVFEVDGQQSHQRTESSASSASKSASLISHNSSAGLLPKQVASTSKQRTLTTSSEEAVQCVECHRFHHNQHRPESTGVKSGGHFTSPPLSPSLNPYAPYPPQWYYLLGGDSKLFRKHKHSHYRKNCKTCQQIVRDTFELYYLGNNNSNTMPTKTGDQLDGGSLIHSVNFDPLLERQPSYHTMPAPPSPALYLHRNRASCGHSCLKFSILFYCCIAIILSICYICYVTRMFGALSDQFTAYETRGLNSGLNDSIFTTTTSTTANEIELPSYGKEQSVIEMIRPEVIGIIVASAIMIIFFLGLIGAFLESVLCLRIFGAILSYLFLLTFGGCFYIIILLVISNVQLKLILSTVSCAAVAITIHALLAIAPFAFADLIYQERQDEKEEKNTYIKYPSVRFLPPVKRGKSHFSLGPFGRAWSSRSMGPTPLPPPLHRTHYELGRNSRATGSGHSSPRNTPSIGDNHSSDGLIPPSGPHTSGMVRFRDNWI